MNILLIGGTGILSTDICNAAILKGMKVTIINRGNNNRYANSNANIIIGDIRNKEDIKNKMKDLYYDVVVDFLSYTSAQLKDTLEIFNGKCNQYIFISSATVYHKKSENEIITEESELNNTEWDYAHNKLQCEKLLEENYRFNNQEYTIVRPYVTYGKTRIPFAIIPRKQWTLANRIILGKPVLLWDNGKAICTLTHTTEFSEGMIGLFGNPKAYHNHFHITSDKSLTWYDVVQFLGQSLKKKPVIAGIPSEIIAKEMPELRGVLFGDKGTNMVFDNSKLKSVVPEFECKITFEEGIKDTVAFYQKTERLQQVDYLWDGRMDSVIKKYYKNKLPQDISTKSISIKAYGGKLSIKDKILYFIGRHKILFLIFLPTSRAILKMVRILKK